MKRANTMSTITVELTIKVKTKFTSSNAEKTNEKTNGFISPQMSKFHTFIRNVFGCAGGVLLRLGGCGHGGASCSLRGCWGIVYL